MLFSVAMFPIGAGDSLCRPVAEAIDVIDRSGLHYQVSGMDTVIEGEWDDVMPVLKQAEARLRRENGRVYMVLTMDDRAGARDRLHASVVEVERELARNIEH